LTAKLGSCGNARAAAAATKKSQVNADAIFSVTLGIVYKRHDVRFSVSVDAIRHPGCPGRPVP